MSSQSVVVTGLGALTPLGEGVPALWRGLLRGHSGVSRLDEPWAAELPVRVAAPVTVDPAAILGRVPARRLDRAQQFALLAAREAWQDAGAPELPAERLAVVIGSGVGGVLTLLAEYDTLRERGARRVSPYSITMFMPNGSASAVGLELGARAGVHTPVSACASGAEAIAAGLDLIRAGRADVVVCGGAEACIHPLSLAAFAATHALSRRSEPPGASRPFDRDRDGFVLGEGAAVVVLEAADHAARRGRPAYAELAGAGVSADAYHMVAPDPGGAGAARAMSGAVRDAADEPDSVVHINAHATSTLLGDAAEAAAIHASFGTATGRIAVSPTKSMTGHLLGAAGAVEAVVTVLSVYNRLAPAGLNCDNLGPDIDLDVVRRVPRRLAAGLALSNSFGFGGHNVSLAFRAVRARGRRAAAA
jgi:3-oxoacyl-[acyl-carrier-protein] synthase II